MNSNIMGTPVYNTSYPNLNTFPHLGAFQGEVGSGNSPGGIGGTWPMNLPISYFWGFSSKTTRKNKKGKRASKKASKSKFSKKCKKFLQKKIKKNIREYKKGRYVSIPQALAVSYAQTRKMCR
jgi:hypothetical protein